MQFRLGDFLKLTYRMDEWRHEPGLVFVLLRLQFYEGLLDIPESGGGKRGRGPGGYSWI